MDLHYAEKQLILYTKGHFKRIDYYNDLKYFAANLYGLSVEQVDEYNILHMVIDLYEDLVDTRYIKFRLKHFLSDVFKRGFNDTGKNEIKWDNVIRHILAEIQGIGVDGLELGKADLSLIPQ